MNSLFNIDALFLVAIVLMFIHLGVPLLYYWYLKTRWFNKPWNVKTDFSYRPEITVIIPTYREAEYIEKKLDNIWQQDYPKDRIQIIVVDSASDDGTPELVKKWARNHPEVRLLLLQEPVRRGMVPALNYALQHVPKNSKVTILTDTDAFWEPDTLSKVISYFADAGVGAVTTCIAPLEEKDEYVEATYRNYYNVIRVGESKIHSTPVHNGALVAFKREILDRIGGLPTYTGNNDSTPASLIAFMGYRAIHIADTIVREPMKEHQTARKIRRAQHLILHFIHTKNYAKKLGIYKRTPFDKIWRIESFLHIVNPWLLLIASVALIASALMGNLISVLILGLSPLALLIRQPRVWLTTQLYLIIATIKNLWNKEIAWKK